MQLCGKAEGDGDARYNRQHSPPERDDNFGRDYKVPDMQDSKGSNAQQGTRKTWTRCKGKLLLDGGQGINHITICRKVSELYKQGEVWEGRTQSLSFLALGTPISSKVLGPLPGTGPGGFDGFWDEADDEAPDGWGVEDPERMDGPRDSPRAGKEGEPGGRGEAGGRGEDSPP